MPAGKIRVLVVDDSTLVREMICDHVAACPDMEVAGAAADGHEALRLTDSLRPDVVTLDVQMPMLDGLATLDAILRTCPIPVIMVSGLTQLGADVTLEALDRGALDYVAKPQRGSEAEPVFREELLRKIRSATGIDVRRILEIRRERKRRRSAWRGSASAQAVAAGAAQLRDKCIATGISTGGPPALSALFETLPPPMPPIVVVQHMPPQFTKPLAARLNGLARLSVKEAETGDVLRLNHVLIAPGGRHLTLRRAGRMVKVVLRNGPPVAGHKPSVDVMMRSAADLYGPDLLGIIMTGMGRDGADGCRAIRAGGGYVLGQDEASSDVYGMNKVAHSEGNVDRQFGLGEAARVIALHVRHRWRRPPVESSA